MNANTCEICLKDARRTLLMVVKPIAEVSVHHNNLEVVERCAEITKEILKIAQLISTEIERNRS